MSWSICYDSDKVLVDILCPFMYPTQLMAEASNADGRHGKPCGSHASYLAAVAMYVTWPLNYLAGNIVASMSV